MSFIHPYFHRDFWGFFFTFFMRLKLFLTGHLSYQDVVSDEIQVAALLGIAISASFLGTFLIFRRMTMLANAISHTLLLGIVMTYLLMHFFTSSTSTYAIMSITQLMIASLITGLLTAFFTEFFISITKLQKDASIGLVFTIFFSLGILLITAFSRNTHIGIELVMGNVDLLQREDLKIIYTSVAFNMTIFLLFFKEFKLTTFDPSFAQILGFSPRFFNYCLFIQTSITFVSALRAVGVLMILSFLLAPPLIARLFTRSLETLILLAIGIGAGGALVGVALSRHILTSYHQGISTGGVIVSLFLLIYVFAALCFSLKRKLLCTFCAKGIGKKV